MGEIQSKITGILEMRGGDFLEFYFEVFLVSTFAIVFGRQLIGLMQSDAEKGPPPKQVPHPYVFAYFRGGVREVVNTAVYGLLLRKAVLLDSKTGMLSSVSGKGARDPIENAVITGVVRPVRLDGLRRDRRFRELTENLRAELRLLGWFKSKGLWRAESFLKLAVMFAFGGLGVGKLAYALGHGRFNVLFLLGQLTLGLLILSGMGGSEQTPAGKKSWQHYNQLFLSLVTASSNLVMGKNPQSREKRQLAFAVFGAAPLIRYDPELARLFSEPAKSLRSSSEHSYSSSHIGINSSDIFNSSSDSSSCSSSSSSDSSCGGGCGGGCGGCGGGD